MTDIFKKITRDEALKIQAEKPKPSEEERLAARARSAQAAIDRKAQKLTHKRSLDKARQQKRRDRKVEADIVAGVRRVDGKIIKKQKVSLTLMLVV